MDAEKTRINAPLYMASTTISCWRCKAAMPAVGLIAPDVPEAEGDVCILCDIRELPDMVVRFVQSRFPSFQLKFSKTMESKYFANHCTQCGMHTGDFYLNSEPGGAFFSMTEEEAKVVTIESIPLDGSINVRSNYHTGGSGDLILNFAKKRDTKPQ